MKSHFLFALFALFTFCSMQALHAQEYRWRAGVDYFFDNMEYKGSSFIAPQTQTGVWLNVLGGIAWSKSHSIYAGVNLLNIPGMKKTVNKTDFTLYYQYESPKILFRAGTFPRKEALPNYSDFFFKDSVNNFIPLMQGIFFQYGRDRNFINAWMDWTGYATENTRESFYIGLSGKASRGIFFGDFQFYLYHYASTLPDNPDYGVIEQLQGMASLGLEYEAENGFKGLLSAGIFSGVERDRDAGITYKPTGFAARANIEYCGIGTENQLYVGDARMRLFSDYGEDLYQGTRFLRGSSYLQNKWYIQLVESDYVSIKINFNLHFTEKKVLTQQAFTVSANIDNFSKKGKKKIDYPWMRIFR